MVLGGSLVVVVIVKFRGLEKFESRFEAVVWDRSLIPVLASGLRHLCVVTS